MSFFFMIPLPCPFLCSAEVLTFFKNINRWYHGRLSRQIAEERLEKAARNGGYLVRESDRKPGSYVLSFFGRTGTNHFR